MTEIFESLREAAYGPTIDGLLSALGALEAAHCVDRTQWDYVMFHLHARKAMDHDSLIRACNTYQIVRDPEEAVRGYGTSYTDAHIRRAVARVLLTPQMLRTYAEVHRHVPFDKSILWPSTTQVHDAMLLATEMALLPKHPRSGEAALGQPGMLGITSPGVIASCACRGATSTERKTLWVNARMLVPVYSEELIRAGHVVIGEGPVQGGTIRLEYGFTKGAAPHADLDVRWTNKLSDVTWSSGPKSFGCRGNGKSAASAERGELPKVHYPPNPSKAHRSLWTAARSIPCGPSKIVRCVAEVRIAAPRTVTKSTKLADGFPEVYGLLAYTQTVPYQTMDIAGDFDITDATDMMVRIAQRGGRNGSTTGA
jgi:hypothetical protein